MYGKESQNLAENVNLMAVHLCFGKVAVLNVAGTPIPLDPTQFKREDVDRQFPGETIRGIRETLMYVAYEKVQSYNATAPCLSFQGMAGLAMQLESQLPEDQRPTTKKMKELAPDLEPDDADERIETLTDDYANWVVLGELAGYSSCSYGGEHSVLGYFYGGIREIANHTAKAIRKMVMEELDEEERKRPEIIEASLEAAVRKVRIDFS
jgi:hypothetical protein